MPTKKNWAGNQQNYVPAGNGDASGEYGDNKTGSNKHYFAGEFKKPEPVNVVDKSISESTPAPVANPDQVEDYEFEFVKPIKKSNGKKINSWSDSDCHDYLSSFEDQFDQEKIKNLDSNTLHELALAQMNLESDPNKKFASKFKKLNDEYWFSAHVPQTYEEAVSKISMGLSKYSIDSAKYKALKSFDLTKWGQEISDYNESKKFVSKFLNPVDPYSQKAKDNAKWFKKESESQKYFDSWIGPEYDKLSLDQVESIYSYTGSGYTSINGMLRYDDEGFKDTKKNIKNMTAAIDQCKLKDDMWVQRGTNLININGVDFDSHSDFSSLTGTVFRDEGFLSTGAAKGTGFGQTPIIMNVYCPKDTKGIYVGSTNYKHSEFGWNLSKWAGSGENELIIQRGYQYKITKVEKSGGKVYLDCEVILNSDEGKRNI